jgi:glycosyltransferase involved in cell wall biosynthesis
MNKQSILYISPVLSSFIKTDLKILEDNYKVIFKKGEWNKWWLIPLSFLIQFLYLLKHLQKVKCIIISFGGYWSLLPTLLAPLFSKKVYIILHGSDCASIPSLDYGNLRKPFLRLVSYWSYKFAYMLLPVSNSLMKTNNTFCQDLMPENKQGVLHFFPNLKTPYKVIPNGFDINFWRTDNTVTKEENRFITVFSKNQFHLKGGDLIIKLAKMTPNFTYVIVGAYKPKNIDIPSNVIFKGRLSAKDLREEYCKSKYYFQLSCFEGFGCSLCEAMLCGCIPIGSNVNAIPEIILKNGLILNERSPRTLKNMLDELNSQEINIDNIREDILIRYPMDLRKKKLKDVIEGVEV